MTPDHDLVSTARTTIRRWLARLRLRTLRLLAAEDEQLLIELSATTRRMASELRAEDQTDTSVSVEANLRATIHDLTQALECDQDDQIEDPDPTELTDQLVDVLDRVQAAVNQDAITETAQRWLDASLISMLERLGVVPILDTGPIDFTRHQVVETRATTQPERYDHIAETIRPGFETAGQLLRPQQIIVYAQDN